MPAKKNPQIVREEKADQAQENNPSPPTNKDIDGTTDPKPPTPSSNRPASPKSPFRPRSRSRHTAVTDEGQIAASMDDLNRLAPPIPGLAEATTCAPERKASPLPSPWSEFSSLAEATPGATASPPIVVSE